MAGGKAGSRAGGQSRELWGDGRRSAAALPASPPARLSACNRCNFPVSTRAVGCKNPCPNCGTIYPLGDCSD
jgi:hypothetical protein